MPNSFQSLAPIETPAEGAIRNVKYSRRNPECSAEKTCAVLIAESVGAVQYWKSVVMEGYEESEDYKDSRPLDAAWACGLARQLLPPKAHGGVPLGGGESGIPNGDRISAVSNCSTPAYNWFQAAEMCYAVGARLCTATEVKHGALAEDLVQGNSSNACLASGSRTQGSRQIPTWVSDSCMFMATPQHSDNNVDQDSGSGAGGSADANKDFAPQYGHQVVDALTGAPFAGVQCLPEVQLRGAAGSRRGRRGSNKPIAPNVRCCASGSGLIENGDVGSSTAGDGAGTITAGADMVRCVPLATYAQYSWIESHCQRYENMCESRASTKKFCKYLAPATTASTTSAAASNATERTAASSAATTGTSNALTTATNPIRRTVAQQSSINVTTFPQTTMSPPEMQKHTPQISTPTKYAAPSTTAATPTVTSVGLLAATTTPQPKQTIGTSLTPTPPVAIYDDSHDQAPHYKHDTSDAISEQSEFIHLTMPILSAIVVLACGTFLVQRYVKRKKTLRYSIMCDDGAGTIAGANTAPAPKGLGVRSHLASSHIHETLFDHDNLNHEDFNDVCLSSEPRDPRISPREMLTVLPSGPKQAMRKIDRSAINLLEVIQIGSFGEITKAQLAIPGDPTFTVAIKRKASTNKRAHADDDLLAEGYLMAQLNHKHVLGIVGVSVPTKAVSSSPDDHDRGGRSDEGEIINDSWIVLEYCEYGSLHTQLRPPLAAGQESVSGKAVFVANCCRRLFASVAGQLRAAVEVAKGMEYLASKLCIHRDLATRNVLISSTYSCKVADFGLSRGQPSFDLTARGYYTSVQGTMALRWSSPEVISNFRFSIASDVWAFGVVMVELFTQAELPYKDLSDPQYVLSICSSGAHSAYQHERPPTMPRDIYQKIVVPCWEFEPTLRPTFSHLRETLEAACGGGPGAVSSGIALTRDQLDPTLIGRNYGVHTQTPRPSTGGTLWGTAHTDALAPRVLDSSEYIDGPKGF